MIEIHGIDEIIGEFHSAQQKAQDMRRTFSVIGDGIAKAARSYAPVRTGRLRRGITAKVSGNEAIISSTVPYGVYQHFGTKYVAANPYMFKALETKEGWVYQEVEKAVEELLP